MPKPEVPNHVVHLITKDSDRATCNKSLMSLACILSSRLQIYSSDPNIRLNGSAGYSILASGLGSCLSIAAAVEYCRVITCDSNNEKRCTWNSIPSLCSHFNYVATIPPHHHLGTATRRARGSWLRAREWQ